MTKDTTAQPSVLTEREERICRRADAVIREHPHDSAECLTVIALLLTIIDRLTCR